MVSGEARVAPMEGKDVNAREPAQRGSRFKRALVWLLVFAVALVAAYGAGWWGPSRRVQDLEQELTTERARANDLGRRMVELEARRSLHAAIIEITQNNFGLAQKEVTRARDLLASSGSGDASLRAVSEALGTLQLDPAQGEQATKTLLELSAAFDAQRPPMPAPPPEATGGAPELPAVE